jgi:glutathione peroxidase-family protein
VGSFTSPFTCARISYAKISVLGADKAPLCRYLTAAMGGEIQWNLTKFLIGRDGKIVARFEPEVTPESAKVRAAIKKLFARVFPGRRRRARIRIISPKHPA